MTTDNQTTNSPEKTNYSRANAIGRNRASKVVVRVTNAMKTLSLRPTKSVKKINSFKPLPTPTKKA